MRKDDFSQNLDENNFRCLKLKSNTYNKIELLFSRFLLVFAYSWS